MKKARFLITLFLIILDLHASNIRAAEKESADFPRDNSTTPVINAEKVQQKNDSSSFTKENPLITEINAENDPLKREELYNKLEGKCPFKKEGSELGAVITNAISLTLSPNLPEAKLAQCTAALKSFNDNVEKSKALNGMVANTTLTDETKASAQTGITGAIAASEGLSNMLHSQCEFQNKDTDLTMVANGIIKAVETGSAVAAYVNPLAGLAGAGAAAVGGLVVSLAEWLSTSYKNEATDEAMQAEKFVNDLCTFRSLATKYDKLYVDPFGVKKDSDNQPSFKPREIGAEERKFAECIDRSKSNLDKLKALSDELNAMTDKVASQKQCLTLFNKYNKNKKNTDNSFLSVAEQYGCPDPNEDKPITYKAYCKNVGTLEAMNDGDIYEKCEKEDFQKMALAKFTSLSDILLSNITDDMNSLAPSYDVLQKAREEDRKQKMAFDQMQALNASLDVHHVTSLSASRTMTDAGRNMLGENFDKYVKKTAKSSDKDFEDAKKKIDDLVDRKNFLENGGIFTSAEKDPIKKAEKQKEICRDVEVAKIKLADAYHASASTKEMCDFMKGDGIPPLKRPGFNYDVYSAGINDQDNNLTTRCGKYVETVNSRYAEIEGQLTTIKTLGCR